MSEIKDVIITGYSNVTKEGVVLHLNKKARLKRGNMSCIEFWVHKQFNKSHENL